MKAQIYLLALCLLCSCATAPKPSASMKAEVPGEAAFNAEAGRGDLLFLIVQVEGSEPGAFVVDTGSPYTILDSSLEAKLGKSLGGREGIATRYGINESLRAYATPRLLLGGTPLLAGERVYVADMNRLWPSRGIQGILGMDCLRHYCVQFDFRDHRARFYDPESPAGTQWGQAIPITLSEDFLRVRVRENLAGIKGAGSDIDTSEPNDGALETKLFNWNLHQQKDAQVLQFTSIAGHRAKAAVFRRGLLAGEPYANLKIVECPTELNVIGLQFLARHCVTFNFPKRTMYLLPTATEPTAENGNSTTNSPPK